MRNVIRVLTGTVLFAMSMSARADDDGSRALILEMVKTHGGQEAIDKFSSVQIKYKGTFSIMGATVQADGELHMRFPDRMKHVI